MYIGIPLQTTVLKKKRKQVLKLLKMLGLGLVAIDAKAETVDVVLDPAEYKPRIVKRKQVRLLGEFERRVGDPNVGGLAMRKGIMTAYRQRALLIGQYLRKHGTSQAAVVAAAVADPKARDVLYNDHYGWFERAATEAKGVYQTTPKGDAARVEFNVALKDIAANTPVPNDGASS